jgi:hypothetical protein
MKGKARAACGCRSSHKLEAFAARVAAAAQPTKVFFSQEERRASHAVAQIGNKLGEHDACPSHSHRFAIGRDNTRTVTKCAVNPAATDKSKFWGRDSRTAG